MIQQAQPKMDRATLQPDEESMEGVPVNASESVVEQSLLADNVGAVRVVVASYNLYWWNVRRHRRWSQLHGRIRGERPFDLIGFQECEDVASVVRSSGLRGFQYHQGPSPNPCPIAWNSAVFSKLGSPGHRWVAKDRWGDRWITWVRLRHIATGAAVLFVNTHGPLGQCGRTLGNNWADGVRANMRAGDVVFMTGDYNCGTGSGAMNVIKGMLTEAVDGGIDQILTNTGRVVSGGTRPGSPSDHPLVKGTFSLPAGGGSPRPAPAPPSPAGNYYRKASRVGGWGGWCTCPDGQRYSVGDNYDHCGSLACEGGTPGRCARVDDPSRRGWKVTCAGAPAVPAPSPPPPASGASCTPFSRWPSVDGGVMCGGCQALVLTAPFGNRCDRYCESFGHVCVAAAEEVNENCEVKYSARCDQKIVGTSDMLCTCRRS